MTDPVKNAPKPRPPKGAMENPCASLSTAPIAPSAKVLHLAVHAWAMWPFEPNATHWTLRKLQCANWPRKRMAKC